MFLFNIERSNIKFIVNYKHKEFLPFMTNTTAVKRVIESFKSRTLKTHTSHVSVVKYDKRWLLS